MMKEGLIIAYADDIAIETESEEEARQVIKELDTLVEDWGLKLNKKKSQIIADKRTVTNWRKRRWTNLEGVPYDHKFKYLGVTVDYSN